MKKNAFITVMIMIQLFYACKKENNAITNEMISGEWIDSTYYRNPSEYNNPLTPATTYIFSNNGSFDLKSLGIIIKSGDYKILGDSIIVNNYNESYPHLRLKIINEATNIKGFLIRDTIHIDLYRLPK